jgi:hypothetical protein
MKTKISSTILQKEGSSQIPSGLSTGGMAQKKIPLKTFPMKASFHFESSSKVDSRVNIDTIIKVASLFPRFIIQEENKKPMEEITKDELEKILHNF